MKISVAQTNSLRGDIDGNISTHLKYVDVAVANGAEMIVFHELSLSGYEPTLAKDLATTATDTRFHQFEKLSVEKGITIACGIPTESEAGICITILFFHPNGSRQSYSKRFLHQDEDEFFVPGEGDATISIQNVKIGMAICYEITIPDHAELAFTSGAQVYIASVVKSVNGVERAINRLTEISKKYSLPVLMSNCVGMADGIVCGGRSSVWNKNGELIAQLDELEEGLLIYDTASEVVVVVQQQPVL